MKNFVHFSNQLEALVDVLKEELYPPGSGPFEKRLIAVPHLGMKAYLMQSLAKDPKMQVAAGLQIVNLDQAFSKITKKNLPSPLELSLFLQYELEPLIEKEEELKRYFKVAAREARIGPFCDLLSSYFLRYAIFGKQTLPPWQKLLWKKVIQKWTFPKAFPKAFGNWQVHLFGFSFLPSVYIEFFQKIEAKFYLFSPCQMFWGDYYSDRERSWMGKEVPSTQLDLFEESFSEQHPLLANWGRVGRKLFLNLEEGEMESEEYYSRATDQTCLSQLQNDLLEGIDSHPKGDETVRCFSTSTPFREVEILKEELITLFQNKGIVPSDVQVFAPDISEYAPYIQAIFGGTGNPIEFSISDLEFRLTDPLANAFSQLIALPKKRFSLANVLQLFARLSFSEEELTKMQGWLESANIRWGISKEQRRTFYLEEMPLEELAANPGQGTWEEGLSRLLLGLGNWNGEESPLPAISATEMELFNQVYTLLYSFGDDLAPFYDGTKWTMPTWLRFFASLLESYFILEVEQEIYRELLQLASSIDHLDQREFPYPAVERVLENLLSKKSQSKQAPHLQAVSFSSLKKGCALPSKVICLLGMGEEAFPRKEESSSLLVETIDYHPKKNEEDRYLFLELLFSSRSDFLLSYVRDEKTGPSPLVEELLSTIDGESICHHPDKKFHPNFSLSDLLDMGPLEKIEKVDPIAIDVQSLFQFARHPLRFYFQKVLGLYPKWPGREEGEYLLSPLTKYRLVQEALENPFEIVWEEAKKRGELPLHLLEPLAKQQVLQEVEKWKGAYEAFCLSHDEITSAEINHSLILENGQEVELFGKIENATSKGILLSAKDSIEDKVRFWPQGLLAKECNLGPLLLVQNGERLMIEGSLPAYIEYFLLAQTHPSPLLPSFAKALLEGTAEDLDKALKKCALRPDEVMGFLFFRGSLPSASAIYDSWSGYLQTIFEGVYATV